jgi:hypothetical protein
MPATFAPITDRPRLFDDGPTSRPRRPAPSARDRAPADTELVPPSPERAADEPRFPPASPDHGPRGAHPAGADAPRHAVTLDHLISGAWDDLTAHRTVSCPVCHGQMAPRYGSGAHPVGGRCRRCGTSLG